MQRVGLERLAAGLARHRLSDHQRQASTTIARAEHADGGPARHHVGLPAHRRRTPSNATAPESTNRNAVSIRAASDSYLP